VSMGAAALCYASDRARTLRAVILESVYHDIGSAFVHRIGSQYPAWYQRLSHGVVWVTERRLGVRLAQLCPAEHVGELAPAPVLLLTGTDDPHAPPDDLRRMFERCGEPRELWLVPRAGHRDVVETGGQAYREHVLGFLARHLAA
jgi:fermentation-respiration switch protein FrsA (DUF1100 family)